MSGGARGCDKTRTILNEHLTHPRCSDPHLTHVAVRFVHRCCGAESLEGAAQQDIEAIPAVRQPDPALRRFGQLPAAGRALGGSQPYFAKGLGPRLGLVFRLALRHEIANSLCAS